MRGMQGVTAGMFDGSTLYVRAMCRTPRMAVAVVGMEPCLISRGRPRRG